MTGGMEMSCLDLMCFHSREKKGAIFQITIPLIRTQFHGDNERPSC